jgi:hypothetical protein
MNGFLTGALAAIATILLLLIAAILAAAIVSVERLRRQLHSLGLDRTLALLETLAREAAAMREAGLRVAAAASEAARAVSDFNRNAFVQRAPETPPEESGFLRYDEEEMAELERRNKERTGQEI